MICERCGAELHVGDFPFCRTGPADHRGTTVAIQPDDVPGGFWVENAWREPRQFYSQKEYERALAADGMELRPRHVPGGKLDNWATMDPYTLENGRILAERQAHTKASDERPDCSVNVTWTTRTISGTPELTIGDDL